MFADHAFNLLEVSNSETAAKTTINHPSMPSVSHQPLPSAPSSVLSSTAHVPTIVDVGDYQAQDIIYPPSRNIKTMGTEVKVSNNISNDNAKNNSGINHSVLPVLYGQPAVLINSGAAQSIPVVPMERHVSDRSSSSDTISQHKPDSIFL